MTIKQLFLYSALLVIIVTGCIGSLMWMDLATERIRESEVPNVLNIGTVEYLRIEGRAWEVENSGVCPYVGENYKLEDSSD